MEHRFWAAAILVWAGALMVLGSGIATAHTASTYFSAFWNSQDLPTIMYKYDAEFPTGNKRSRVDNSAGTWNGVTSAEITILPSSGDYSSYSSGPACSQPEDKNGIHWENIGDYGLTRKCIDTAPNPDKMYNAQLVLDNTLPGTHTWYDGTGDPPSGKADVWSIATHEMAHFAGWATHFTEQSRCPTAGPFSAWETMCASVDSLTSGDEYGKKFRRTLEAHDIDTFQNAY